MEKITWEVEYTSSPKVIKYCKKCGKKTEYICSELFRINAQRKSLDIWLIYKCENCNTTWNLTIYSRINPKSIDNDILEKFHENDRDTVKLYSMDRDLIERNGGEVKDVNYKILGESIKEKDFVELHIKSNYKSNLKVSKVLKEGLGLSEKELLKLIETNKVKSLSGDNLKKTRLKDKVIIYLERI